MEKKHDPKHPEQKHDPKHTAPAQHTAIGTDPAGVGADPSSGQARRDEADAIQARSTEAFNAARDAGSRDVQGTPVDGALRTVKEALQNLPDDQSRRVALREAAQACGIDITTLSADPALGGTTR